MFVESLEVVQNTVNTKLTGWLEIISLMLFAWKQTSKYLREMSAVILALAIISGIKGEVKMSIWLLSALKWFSEHPDSFIT